jgi:hypothetical protein
MSTNHGKRKVKPYGYSYEWLPRYFRRRVSASICHRWFATEAARDQAMAHHDRQGYDFLSKAARVQR